MRTLWPNNILTHYTVITTLISSAYAFTFETRKSRPAHSNLPPGETEFNSSPNTSVLSPRGEFDLSFNSFAALGDSYASGLGAGHVLDRTCRRYHHSYPYLIITDPRLGSQEEVGTRFEPLTCAGATIRDVLEKQVPQLTTNFDVITITAGGNDVGFGKIVDTCIFGIGRSPCERTLAVGRSYINDFLPQRLDRLLRHLSTRLTPHMGRLYITGYAKFFNADSTQCNAVSVSLFGRKMLDQYHRQNYNDLIDLVNLEISLAAKRAGPHVTFVDYDPYFGQCEGRLCEFGVNEPHINRPKLLFFERGSRDVSIPDRDSTLFALVRRRFENFTSLFRLPDSDLRIFHPRSTGQRVIADAILAHMRQDKAKAMGLESTPLEEITCPW